MPSSIPNFRHDPKSQIFALPSESNKTFSSFISLKKTYRIFYKCALKIKIRNSLRHYYYMLLVKNMIHTDELFDLHVKIECHTKFGQNRSVFCFQQTGLILSNTSLMNRSYIP